MNPHYTYFLILAASLSGPLLLSFDKKVAFYKKWKYLFPAMLLPALFYILWDSWFTQLGVWSFNPAYITGMALGNLPVEEVLFFFVVPYCCVFIYECIVAYFPHINQRPWADRTLGALATLLLILGIFCYQLYYTAFTFCFFAFFVALFYWKRQYFSELNTAYFLLSYAIILIPFLVVNGFLTAIPVVLYNDAENLGLRIYTIPIEDSVYGMLLIGMNLVIYQKLKKLY